jgi:hypothetical protein
MEPQFFQRHVQSKVAFHHVLLVMMFLIPHQIRSFQMSQSSYLLLFIFVEVGWYAPQLKLHRKNSGKDW